ncbi:MAG: hypothetical protein JEZ07_12250 [Phycisphaerae bacterium]|nr:hypothetical protein [Phycisphaerae bacterium]
MGTNKKMDHSKYQRAIRRKSDAVIRFIIDDCREALRAFPENPNAGYYCDEICYCSAELKRRHSDKKSA